MSGQPIKIFGVILAAGKSTRMGKNKLALRAKDGAGILETIIIAAKGAKLDDLCVLTGGGKLGEQAVQTAEFIAISSKCMADSVQAALEIAVSRSATHLMVILGDMPAVTVQDINILIANCKQNPDAIIRACHHKKPGNPVILPLKNASAFKAQLNGDEGARAIIQSDRYTVIDAACSAGVLIDIDTPEAYDNYLRN